MQEFEKLGAFYLGKRYDVDRRATTPELVLYDSRDLTTHAMTVGMTGSGKTGLCLSLLEEAAIDGIPALVVDPKGDLGNLLLTFPNLDAADFLPWIEAADAERRGLSLDELAAQTAAKWRTGLEEWGQDGTRIQRFREAADVAIYTPGSRAGLPLSVLHSFDAPSSQVRDDQDALSDRVTGTASGVLAMLGIEADPVRSREHILISKILSNAWQHKRNLDIAGLLREIQQPSFGQQVGVLDLETFFPQQDRQELAMALNHLLASPSFQAWLEGEALDIKRLLYTPQGRPRISIVSIAHLNDQERMFFVTLLLNELLAWTRSQPGTSSLRAIFYMDEIFGYFPPTANPPSKPPMLTLLKQARAYGVGLALATQNPVDLDYKGLSNCGTWFIGRLQTERDKARVMEGLQGASTDAGASFDRAAMERTLSSLGSRIFLMHNVHEDTPVVFHTRWALSYLRGPLTRSQIDLLMEPRRQTTAEAAAPPPGEAPPAETTESAPQIATPPAISTDVRQRFLAPNASVGNGRWVYRPSLLATAKVHYVRVKYKVDTWIPKAFELCLRHGNDVPDTLWEEADPVDCQDWNLQPNGIEGAEYAVVPQNVTHPKYYKTWQREFKEFLYRTQHCHVWYCATLKQYSDPDEAEDDFRIRLGQLAREKRDAAVEKLRKRYASKVNKQQERIRRAEERIEREESQYRQRKLDTVWSFGASILGAVLGRKLGSRTNVSKAATSMRSVGRAAKEREDVVLAKQNLQAEEEKLKKLAAEGEAEVTAVEQALSADALELEQLKLPPRKSDMDLEPVTLLWVPHVVGADGAVAAVR